ncbi:hypothetical protein RUM44_003390 [Polyplax serrata]|uniref:Ig-like domain-containing protein n=1 Tax=Polyplax serrata TaxID=468196 RepID=A0ABR1AHW5_POLSC
MDSYGRDLGFLGFIDPQGKTVRLRDGVQVELDSERFVDGTPEHPNLLIRNSSRYDQGVYTCICENEVGSSESSNSIYVNILHKPSVRVVIDPPPPVNEIDKVNVLVICEVTAGNPEILQVVRWYLNGTLLRELPECNPDNDTFCDIDPSHLLLEPAIRDLHGNYSCEGMNEAGWGPLSEDTELVVYYPPGPATLIYEPQRVVKGKPVNLMCLVEDLGRPPSDTYRWVRGSHLIQDVTSYNWTMDSVTLETEANFTCSAYNLGGEGQSFSTSIEVFAPPAFIERLPPYYGALMSAQHINISCRVECSPLCTVSWLKNGRPIEKTAGSSTLLRTLLYLPIPSTNDFNSIQSTLMWNMNAWPGGQLDRLYDNANYTCQSTGNTVGGGVRSTTFFGVEYPPENITLSTKVISVVEGQEMQDKVTCQAKAYPEASYLWRKEGETETITKGNVFMLRYQVPRKDGGNYVCEAYNRHGNVTGSTFLNVLFKPECAITQTEQNGKQVLICTAHANPTEVNFMWKIKNENETVEDLIEDKGLQSFLTLESRIENFRTYLCFANNSVGMSIPCERDVTGKAAWWPMFDNDNLLIVIAVIVGAILMFLIVCVIIIFVCRKKRAEDKYTKSVELEERQNPSRNPTSPVIVQQQPVQNTTMTPKWPLKPGVLVHANGARFTQGLAMSLSSLPKANAAGGTPVGSQTTGSGKSRAEGRKIWNLQRRRAVSLGSLALPDDTSQRSRVIRIRKMFSPERPDSLPNGVSHGKSGVVTFKRIEDFKPATVTVSRKRKKPGDAGEKKVTNAEKTGLNPTGSHCDGLDDRAFYENLPFHGMQNPPTKNGFPVELVNNKNSPGNLENGPIGDGTNRCVRTPNCRSSGRALPEGVAFRRARRRLVKSNTVRAADVANKPDLLFHSLRVYKKGDNQTSNGFARIQTTSEMLLNTNNSTGSQVTSSNCFQNSTQCKTENSSTILEVCDEKEEAPKVPDRKFKPKFFNGKFKWRSTDESFIDSDESFLNNRDNESLISGIERLSNSPAPVPAPRRLVTSGLTRASPNTKHTYQNVPIPISPNNSQDFLPENERSLEARHYKLTSSQQHLLPLNNKKYSHQAAYNLLQSQGRVRHSGKRSKYETNSMRHAKKSSTTSEFPPGYTVNGSLRQNQLFFNSLRDVNKQLTSNNELEGDYKSRVKSDGKSTGKDFRERAKERLKDSTPLQVMRFKELLTAGESYNRQSNSDSSGERRLNTDSSSGDTEMPISDSRHFRNISSGEESLLRDCSKSSYVTIPGDHEICRPIPINGSKVERRSQTNSLERSERSLDNSQRSYGPVPSLPVQAFYTPMASDPSLLPHYASLGSDLTPNSESLMPPGYAEIVDSDGSAVGSDDSPAGSESFVKKKADFVEYSQVADEKARNVQIRNTRNLASDLKRNSDYAALKFHDIGHEIDV